MKTKYIILSLAVTAFAVGCSPTQKTSMEKTSKEVVATQESAKIAAKDMQAYTFEKKTEYIAYMTTQQAELDANIQELTAKIEASSDKVKADAKPKLAALKEQAAMLKKQIAATAQATPTTWSGIKADSSKAYNALKDGVTQSRQWLADTIAP